VSLLPEDLQELERAVQHAFRTGDAGGLDVLGFGEMSSTIRWRSAGSPFACKRLPVFATESALERYSSCFEAYLKRLAEAGITVAPSILQRVQLVSAGLGGKVAAYCVQPAYEPEDLLTRVLARSDERRSVALFVRLQQLIGQTVSTQLGLDGQASNWVVTRDRAAEGEEPRLLYLDVTTPMLRDEAGRDQLDTELFLAAAPAPARGLLRRFLLQEILDKYHSPRGVLLDLVANFYKEDLARLVPLFLQHQADWVSPPLEPEEVTKYYRFDARVWALWQRLRRTDRWWQLKVRRRPYPFLLPPEKIERHL
jgi:hypothetical protein